MMMKNSPTVHIDNELEAIALKHIQVVQQNRLINWCKL